MHLLYAVSALGNPLYNGRFEINGRYRTYGQHSFLYDFAAACYRAGHQLDLFVAGLSSFPIGVPLAAYCRVYDASEISSVSPKWSAAIIDMADGKLLSMLPNHLRAIFVVHNPYQPFVNEALERCDAFMCLTKYTYEGQLKNIQPPKLVFIPQGIDLQRFTVSQTEKVERKKRKILVYSRLDAEKRNAVNRVIRALARLNVDLTVLGDGEGFWSLSDDLARDITLINFIPCHSIHRILGDYDLVVSSGRGVMEALACGKPAICVGRTYGGPVLEENIEQLHRINFTGRTGTIDAGNLRNLHADIEAAFTLQPETCRLLAEQLFDGDNFVRGVSALVLNLFRSENGNPLKRMEE